MDSHVLLHLCASLRNSPENPKKFHAVHVHHGLQASADAWTTHCSKICGDLNVPLLTIRVDARANPGDSPEEVARRARYRALREHLAENDIVLTAQHRDDQAETLLLQLMRGAGLAGLAAMPEFAPLAPGFLLRPLLSFSRQELRAYALANGLNWIEDPSNCSEVGTTLARSGQGVVSLSRSLRRSATTTGRFEQRTMPHRIKRRRT